MALNGYRSREDRASRLLETVFGLVTIVRIAERDYEVFKEGVRMGRVTKRGRGWYTERGDITHTSRHDAIHSAITEWYQRAKARGALAQGEPK